MRPPQINFSGLLHQTVLFSLESMKELLGLISPFKFYNVSSLQHIEDPSITLDQFLAFYDDYLNMLLRLNDLDLSYVKAFFSLAIASGDHCFTQQILPNNRCLFKPLRSVIQLQPLGLFISSVDKKVHIKGFSQESASFGLKVSFATIYEDTAVHKIYELSPSDVEYQKFITLRQFIRKKTKPLILEFEGEKTVTQVRYSQSLQPQIAQMTCFAQHGLKVVV